MGGTKRKIAIMKRETQPQRAVAFSKRRRGLFNKAAELCVISGAQVAVLATPPSDKLNTFYSFGHSSVDEVVDAFLAGRPPRTHESCLPTKKPGSGLGFLWENCDDPDELRSRIEKLQTLKNNVETCLANREKKIVPLEHWTTELTEEVKNKKEQETAETNDFTLELDHSLLFPDGEVNIVQSHWYDEKHVASVVGSSEPNIDYLAQMEAILMMD